MRFVLVLIACILSSVVASVAEVADREQQARRLSLLKLATEIKELNRCMGVISVEDLAAFEPIMQAYHRKTDELAKAIEDFVSRYSSRRTKQQTVHGFRYLVWDATLQASAEKARPASALKREICAALTK